MKRYVVIYAVTAAIVAAIGIFGARRIKTLREENKRLQANQTALLSSVANYKTEAGKNAASIQALELTKDELETNCAALTSTIADLNVKLKRVKAAAETATKTQIDIRTEVRDSIVYRDTALVNLRVIEWSDPWVDIQGAIDGSQIALHVVSSDTLTQVVHRIPHRFLFFRWGTKAVRQEIRSSNPHTTITYTDYIEIKK
jgi:hypothetical protein